MAPSLRQAILLSFEIVVVGLGCSAPSSVPVRVFRRPTDLAIACLDTSQNPLPLASCPLSAQLRGFVLDADRSGIGIISLTSGEHLDMDPFLPGFSPLQLRRDDGSLVLDLVSIKAQGTSEAVFALGRREKTLVKIDAVTFKQAFQDLPCEPTSFDIKDTEEGSLIVACPSPPELVLIPIDTFGHHDPKDLPTIPISGAPFYVSVSRDGLFAYVTHRSQGAERFFYLSKVTLETGSEEVAGILPACSDGLDNDGDGLTDGQDLGCESPSDTLEDPDRPLPCRNGLDDDGDGLTDLDDPDCPTPTSFSEFRVLPPPECANGADDDEDGLTDWPSDRDCYGPDGQRELSPPLRVVGPPTVTPDGRYVYVSITNPPEIKVFETTPLRKIDVTAPDGPAPNPLYHHLGLDGIVLTSPVLDLEMLETPSGQYAFAGLASGQVLRILVGPKGHKPDRGEDAKSIVPSVPKVRIGTKTFQMASSSEYPSFGQAVVAPLEDGSGRYSYYGITFLDHPEIETTEEWHVTYEGVIPQGHGKSGFFDPKGSAFYDPFVDFCALGVEKGDHLVVTSVPATCFGPPPGPRPTCPEEASEITLQNLCEYEVVDVFPSKLVLREIEGFRGLDLLSSSQAPFAWEVRVSKSWTVVGSFSGFLHGWRSEDGKCVKDEGLFNSRAKTSRFTEGASPTICPPPAGSDEVEWERFQNHAFSFTIFPPCKVGIEKPVEECAILRDTEISFAVSSGQRFVVASVGGFPQDLKAARGKLYVVESVGGTLHTIEPETMSVVQVLH